MKNKIITIFILLFLSTSCGYQPLYKQNENNKNYSIKEIQLVGNKNLSEQIFSKLPITIKKNDEDLDKLIITSDKKIIELSKNSKGQITSYRSEVMVTLKIINKENQTKIKNFKKDFSYNDDENKFKLKEYQNNIEENLIDSIVEDITLHITY